MTDKPQITNLDEAKAALDEDIASLTETAKLFEASVEREKAKLARYEETLWRLKSLRLRMDPPKVDETLPAVADAEPEQREAA